MYKSYNSGMGLILSALLGLSLIIRGVSVPTLPPELFGDEVDVGYQAFSLLHTGKDLYNRPFPVYIRSLSEWRAPLLMYYTVPAIALFGNTEWGVRAPEVILGSLAPLILFLLVFQLTKSKYLSLLSSIILSIMPWHILYSRAAFETVLLLDFVMLGTVFFLKKKLFISLLFFVFTPYIYSTAVVFVPLWLAALYILNRPRIRTLFLLPLILLIPFAVSVLNGQAAERFGRVGLFGNSDITDQITRMRRESGTPWERLFSNKAVYIAGKIYNNYLSAFSPEFLFIRGDNTARQSLQYIGELLPVWAPFLILGWLYMIKHRQYIWLVWLLLAPMPAALTYDGAYHATRLFMMIPPLAVSVAYGIYGVVKSVHPRFLVPVYILIWLIISAQFLSAANYYFYHYPQRTWIWWHVGFKQAMQKIGEIAPRYSKVYLNNSYEPSLIRFLFYTRYPAEEFHKNYTNDHPSGIAPGYYGFYLAPKYYFGGFSVPQGKSLSDILEPDSLYLVSQRDDVPGDWDWRTSPPSGIKVLFTSTNPLNQPVFYLVAKS